MRDNFAEDEKEQWKIDDKKRKREMRHNFKKKKKNIQKKRIAKEKKAKRDNLDDIEKGQLRKYQKERKFCVIILMMKKRSI